MLDDGAPAQQNSASNRSYPDSRRPVPSNKYNGRHLVSSWALPGRVLEPGRSRINCPPGEPVNPYLFRPLKCIHFDSCRCCRCHTGTRGLPARTLRRFLRVCATGHRAARRGLPALGAH